MATLLSIDESPLNQATTNDFSLPSSGDIVTALNTYFTNTTWTSSVLQAARKTGALTGLSNTIDLALTNSTGGLLNGVDSGLNDLNGNDILLYTDMNNNNLVIGKVGTTVMFAIYLDATGSTTDQGATGADLWMVTFQPIQHNLNGADPNDFVSITGKLYSSVTNPISFDATGAPSGANLFITFGDGTPAPGEVSIVVTAVGAADQGSGANVSSGATVKTSQGGLPGGTFGVDSQMINPPGGKYPAGEGMYFTFVTGANPDYIVTPGKELTPTEANLEANIQFTNYFGATKVSFRISQLQPASDECTVKVSALIADAAVENGTGVGDDVPFTGNSYIPAQETNTLVDIDKVTITRGTSSWTFVEGQAKPTGAPSTLNVDFTADGSMSAIIEGLVAGDKVEYEAPEHDRMLINNPGNSDTSQDASFDIGEIQIVSGGITTNLLDPIDIYDDGPNANGTPVAASVDEDGTPLLAGANTNAALGDSNAGSTATGSIAGIFNAGRDGLQTFQLNSVTSGLPQNLTSQGGAVLYNVNGTTLTAYVEVSNANGNGYNATDDREVFTLALSGTNNSTYLFTLIDQLDHPLTNDPNTGATETLFEDDLTLNLGTILQIKDGDNDVATGDATDFVITLDDDSPVINGSSNIVYANTANGAGGTGGSGTFDYSIGTDDRVGTTYSATNKDLIVTLSGSVGANAITSQSVTWFSETSSSAVYNFTFTYVSDPIANTTTVDTGTITFDKLNDTYSVVLAQPISSYAVLSLADPTAGFTGYQYDSTTLMGGLAGVTTAKLANNFYVQFKGFAEPSGNGNDSGNALAGNANLDALDLTEGWSSPDDDVFTSATGASSELFTLRTSSGQNAATVSISGSSAGTNSDTMQSGEVLDFTLYSGDPQGLLSGGSATKTSVGTIFIEFDQLSWKADTQAGEDMVIVLKLVDANNPALTTTRAVIVQASDIYHAGDTLPTGFGFTQPISGNNGLVILERNDYNFGSDNWIIQGAQVLASTEGVTSAANSAVDLNKAVGSGGFSTLTSAFSASADSGNATASTWDSDVFKIVNIGFVTSNNQDAALSFGVKAVDYDGDTTGSQTLGVSIVSGSTFTGTSATETFAMTDISAVDLDSSLSVPTRAISGFNANGDLLDFAVDATATNFASGANPFADLNAFLTQANTQLDGTIDYYFGVVGGDGYLAYDADGIGMTALIQLTGVTTNFDHVDII
jgi:hypothetical protein